MPCCYCVAHQANAGTASHASPLSRKNANSAMAIHRDRGAMAPWGRATAAGCVEPLGVGVGTGIMQALWYQSAALMATREHHIETESQIQQESQFSCSNGIQILPKDAPLVLSKAGVGGFGAMI